jgi:hypothetical protein
LREFKGLNSNNTNINKMYISTLRNVYATLLVASFVVIGSDYLDAQPSIRTASTSFLNNLAGLKLRLQEATKFQRITLNILFDPSVMLNCEITIVIRDKRVTVKTTKADPTTDEVEEPSLQSAAAYVQKQPTACANTFF